MPLCVHQDQEAMAIARGCVQGRGVASEPAEHLLANAAVEVLRAPLQAEMDMWGTRTAVRVAPCVEFIHAPVADACELLIGRGFC